VTLKKSQLNQSLVLAPVTHRLNCAVFITEMKKRPAGPRELGLFAALPAAFVHKMHRTLPETYWNLSLSASFNPRWPFRLKYTLTKHLFP
jgi:hypothetical protein